MLLLRLTTSENDVRNDEIRLINSLSLGNCEKYSQLLPQVEGLRKQEALDKWHALIEFYAINNENQDWWYLPVSEGQPNMSVIYNILELDAQLQTLSETTSKQKYVIKVINEHVATYILLRYSQDKIIRATANPKHRLMWFLERKKVFYRRYLNGLLWLYEKILIVHKLKDSKFKSDHQESVDTILFSRFETGLETQKTMDVWTDSYLGSLPQDLWERGQSVILVGRSGGNPEQITKAVNKFKSFPVLSIEQFIDIKDLFKILIRAYKLKMEKQAGNLLSYILYNESRNHIRAISDCLLVQFGIQKLLSNIKVKQTLCMQENSIWEHAVQRAVKEKVPEIRSVGYFHCPVMPSALRYHTSSVEIEKRPLFDHTITLGAEMAHALGKLGPWENKIIAHYAFRNPGIKEALKIKHVRNEKSFNILVLLGGMYDNSAFLAWVDEARQGLLNHKMIIKGHPVYGADNFIKGAKININRDDIEDTKLSLSEALKQADCVVYKGTTAGLSALAAGIPVIHVNHAGILSDDTLFNIPELVFSVNSQESFRQAVLNIEQYTQEEITAYTIAARKYVQDYYDLNIENKNQVLDWLCNLMDFQKYINQEVLESV